MVIQYFTIKTDKPALSYKVGEEICFYIFPRRNNGGCDLCSKVAYKIEADDGTVEEGVASCLPKQFCTVKYVAKAPGFVRILVKSIGEETSVSFNDVAPGDITDDFFFYPFSSCAGVELDKVKPIVNPPEDFDAYWDSVKKTVEEFTPELLLEDEIINPQRIPDDMVCHDVRISTPQGRPASGYIIKPKKAGKYPIIISFNGYSLAGAAARFEHGAICVNINAHGIENGFSIDAMNQKYEKTITRRYGFDEEENQKPETCYWHNMIIRDLCALKYAKSLDCWDGKTIVATGGSQAAFQAICVAAHDKDVSYLDARVPWFCDDYTRNPNIMPAGFFSPTGKGAEYFYNVCQAHKITCPTNVMLRLGDPTCIPYGIMAFYNLLNCKKKIDLQHGFEHSQRPFEMRHFISYSGEIRLGKYKHFSGKIVEVIGFSNRRDEEKFTADIGPHFAIKSFSADEQPTRNVLFKEEGDDNVYSLCENSWFDSFFENGRFVESRYTFIEE